MVSTTKKQDLQYECPVCLDFCAEPVMTPCKHLFCLSCQKKIQKDGMKCPLCRAHFDKAFVPVVDIDLQQKLAEQYTEEFEERKQELIALKQWRGNKVPMRFAFGNLYKKSANPIKFWGDKNITCDNWFQLFVCLNNDAEQTSKFVSKVVYHLHETFRNPVRTVHEAPFLLAATAYGYFEVQIDIHFQKWTGLGKQTVNHMISFDKNGKTQSFDMDIDIDHMAKAEEVKVQKENKAPVAQQNNQSAPKKTFLQKGQGIANKPKAQTNKPQLGFGTKAVRLPEERVEGTQQNRPAVERPAPSNNSTIRVGQAAVREEGVVQGFQEMFNQMGNRR